MESSIRIVHCPETNEFCVEAYGANSQHLGSRYFKTWSHLILFLSVRPRVQLWLKEIVIGKITDEEAEQSVREWPV